MVHGTAPKGLKQPFVPELRLLGCVEVDRVFALPLQKDTDLVAVPLNAKIKLQRARNMDQLGNFIEYTRFLEKAQRLLTDARNRLQVVDLKLSEKDKKDTKNSSHKIPTLVSGLENGYVLRKSMSCDVNKYHHADLTPLAEDYDDVDQIYDYVRGFAPLPKNLNRSDANAESYSATHQIHNPTNKSTNNNQAKSQPDSGNYSLIKSSSNSSNRHEYVKNGNHYTQQHIHHQHHHYYSHVLPTLVQDDSKPIPPPIETIPGKKVPEKRQRLTLAKLYVNHTRRQPAKLPICNSPGVGIVINNNDALEPHSPLFHIR